jgi:hypothetical protein
LGTYLLGVVRIFAALLSVCSLAAADPTAQEIMKRVAANQTRAEEMRTAFVYEQRVRVRLIRGGGAVAREEVRDYVVTPTAKGSTRELKHFEGRYRNDKTREMISYDKPGYEKKEVDIDANVAESLGEEFGSDRKARDGLDRDMFSFSHGKRERYRFGLEGTEEYRGRTVYRIQFEPHQKKQKGMDDWGRWKGEILVDRDEYEPVVLTAQLDSKLPLWIRTVFGTNISQVGYKVSYEKFADRVWFPVTFGTELKVKALFFYKRTISVGLVSSGFQRAEVESSVEFEGLSQ